MLFVAEAVTLAHVARPLALSASVDRTRFDVSFACAERSHWLLQEFAGDVLVLDSIDGATFMAALARGKPLYDEATLMRYVAADLALLKQVQPDVVIGDFRLSLSISARLAKVAYWSITNCYWSPCWRPQYYPVPDLPLSRTLPLPMAQILFQIARPVAFALHCRPLNRVRQRHGLPALGHDLRRVYTDADHVLYADVPELFPGVTLPPEHHFIGPVPWSPPVPAPSWWQQLDAARRVIYITLGSSGQAQLLAPVLAALSTLDASLIVSTAGATVAQALPSNAYGALYLPGNAAAARSSLVICNGGSPTSHQALAAGIPVIGIAGNLDQFLNMATICETGAGELMRADHFDGKKLFDMTEIILSGHSHVAAAKQVERWFDACPSPLRFASLLDNLVR